MPRNVQPRLSLALLTALNFFNYIDRSALFAVQPLVKQEFHSTDANLGFLTTAFFFGYMFTAPFFGFLADRYSRKTLIVLGATIWSGATLLTATAHNFPTLLFRHTVVGIGEASFATIAAPFLADLFGERQRGRILSIFALANPAGTALGYVLGGFLGQRYGWRSPFYIAAIPGFLLAIAFSFIREPERGRIDSLPETAGRGTLLGLSRNGAYWTATLGMAAMTFALGGLSVWMPTFLSRARDITLGHANLYFGAITAFNGIVATLFGGWLGDRLLRRTRTAYYLVSGVGMALALPVMAVAIYRTGRLMFPAIFLGEFLLLVNTGPLDAAVINSVGAHIRSRAVAVNLFVIHALGDAFSPSLMGYISDRSSLEAAFGVAIVAIFISAAILLFGSRFAPRLMPESTRCGV
jgi:MFS family permease